MRWLLRLVALVVTTGALLAGGSSAAFAAEPTVSSRAAATASGEEVTGQPWSAPAQPVACTLVASTVSCVPVDNADTVPSGCFKRVQLGAGEVTVCSTAKSNQEALKKAGAELKYEWGCQATWDVCATMEGLSESMATTVVVTAAKVWDAFRFNTSSLLWTAAVDQWSFWVWAVWIVIVAAGIIAITQAAFSGSPADVIAAVVRMGVAFPLTQASLWLMGQVLNAVDQLTIWLVNDAPLDKMSDLLFASGIVNPLGGVAVMAMVMVAVILMLFTLMFRNIALAALIMVGPLAWMLFPMRSIGKEWLVRYFSAFAALLLAGPLMMSLLGMITTGLDAVNSLWDPSIWPFLLALVLLCFAPLAVFTLFSFVGGTAVDQVAGSAAARVKGGSQSLTRAIPRPRAGQAPAGRPGGAGAAGAAGPGRLTPSTASTTPRGGASRPASAPAPVAQPTPATAPRSTPGASTPPPTGRTR